MATATTYELQQRQNSGAWGTVQNTAATSRGLSGVGIGVWGYRVRACNSAGCAGWSAIHSVVVEMGGGCDPFFGCGDPQAVPEDPPEDW